MEEILERQSLIRGRASATFFAMEKTLAGRTLCRLADYEICTLTLKRGFLMRFACYIVHKGLIKTTIHEPGFIVKSFTSKIFELGQ